MAPPSLSMERTMAKVSYQSYTSVALSATGFASAVAYSGGGYALSATTPNDGTGHLVTFLNNTATTHVGQNITFTGTDANDNPLTETLTGPGASVAITTAGFYKTLTSVTASATTGADTFNIGWTAGSVGATIYPIIERFGAFNTEIFCLVASGSPTYGVDYTADATPAGLIASSWLAHATIVAKTVTFDGQLTYPVLALRLHFTATGKVNITVIEESRMGQG